MNITIVYNGIIPVIHYGGTQRVIWYLGKELSLLGHKITYLVDNGSYCDFADIKTIDYTKDIWSQVPDNTDIIHFHQPPVTPEKATKPYVVTIHGNPNGNNNLDANTIFVSKNHAERYNSTSYVYNGLDWDDYKTPTFTKEKYFHFLGKAAWRIKNVKGAINVIKKSKDVHLKVLGGYRFNFKMGLRFTLTPKARFYGMVGGDQKNELLDKSLGLIFPVRWHEPFGLAIIESLFYGCPVFGTPYGSLKELVTKEIGFLSNKESELSEAISNVNQYSKKLCHSYAVEHFNSKKMSISYLKSYEKVLNGEVLNPEKPKLKMPNNQKFLDWF